MSNVLTNAGKNAILSGGLTGKTLKVVLVDDGVYTYSSSHANLSDIASGARIATSNALTGVTYTNGVLDSDDFTISGVSGATVERAVLFIDTGTASTSTLLAHY